MAHRLLLLVLLASTAAIVLADVPLHCLEPQIQGLWHFQHTGFKYDLTVDCASVSADAFSHSLTVELGEAPEIESVDGAAPGAQSRWTMIYDESFELRFHNQVWWSRFHYGKMQAEQDCSRTMVGVAHELAAEGTFPNVYACFRGTHVRAADAAPHVLDPMRWRILPAPTTALDATLADQLDQDLLVEAVAKADAGWTAQAYPKEMISTIATALRRQGAWPRVTPRARANAGSINDLPRHFDWSNVDGNNFLGPVMNQGHCGSCYTFGSLGSINDRVRVATNLKVQPSLAEQEILSCSHYSEGCDGGIPYNVAKYVRDFGIVEDKCMAYEGHSTECKFSCSQPEIHRIRDYGYIGGAYGLSSEEGMMRDLHTYGPLTVSFLVTSDFMRYKGGVYRCDSLPSIRKTLDPAQVERLDAWEATNHSVLLVGWGVAEDGTPFWRVRNSWGTAWGEQGFFRIHRGTDCLAVESCTMSIKV